MPIRMVLKKNDPTRHTLINSIDFFGDVREMCYRNIALMASLDKLDIAVDLKCLTKDKRFDIFAYRTAAPIQMSFLAYLGTTGKSFIDDIIADPIVIPPNQVSAYFDKIIYLPNTNQPNDYKTSIHAKVGTSKYMGLPDKNFVFFCFNNNYKITSIEFDIWMRILANVKESVLGF